MTTENERDSMPTPRDLASEDDLTKARERGVRLGFEGMFLDHFIENELRMMVKWKNRRERKQQE